VVDLIEQALALQIFLEGHGCRFCFIGGLSVQWWGEPRLTRDIDVSLLAGFGDEAAAADLLLGAYAPRIADAREFALQRRVLLLRAPSGAGIDISLAGLPFEERMIERARPAELYPGHTLKLCSPEDLIVMKLFAARDTDLRDARSVAIRQARRGLDWSCVEKELAELADLTDDPGLMARLEQLRESANG
jgi:hypothetical protein